MKSKLGFAFMLPWLEKPKAVIELGFLRRLLRDQRGSYTLLMALLLPALVAIAGLAVEGSYWLFNHRLAQSAADNAAYSVATALAINGDSTSSDLLLQAKGVAGNDFNLVDGTNGVTVAVHQPPVGTCYPGSQYIGPSGAGATEVVVKQSLGRLFSAMLMSGNASICGRAVAIVSGGGQCVLALGKTGTVISTTKNNLSITFTGCGFFSNSSDPASISITGNNDQIQAESVGTVGGAVVSGNLKTKVSVTTGNPQIDDPYATRAASWPTSQPTAPTAPTGAVTTCPSCTPPTLPTACSSGKNGVSTITLGPGNWSNSNLSNVHLDKCSTINLSGGTYLFASAPSLSGATVNVQAASNIIVQSGSLSTGNINFSGGNYSIYVAAGDWNASGPTSFGSGNYTIGITTSGGTGGNWNLGGTATFGTGTYNVTLGAAWAMSATTTPGNFGSGNFNISTGGNWTIARATTFGNGNFNITVAGNWAMSSAVTLGNGNYTFALTGDLTTSDNFTAGSGTWSGSMANWTITGTSTTIGNGIYYLSGNFNINGNGNQTVTASSATLVLTGAGSIVNYSANNSIFTLTAPTAFGWNQSVAIWEPTSNGSNQLASGNNSTANITGLIYAPKADVQYLGNTGSSVCTQIVAKSVEFGGNSISFQGGCTASVPGLKTFGQIIALVE